MSQDLWRERHTPGTEEEWLDREHTCHDRCPCQLRERIARSFADMHDIIDNSEWEALDSSSRARYRRWADAALTVVQPELDRRDDLAAELRRQVQSRTRAMDELFRTREKARKEASEARSELADMTAQRDLLGKERAEVRKQDQRHVSEIWDHSTTLRRAEEAEASAKLYLKERDEALTERDDAIRSADAAAAQRDELIEASLATDYTKDHECGTAVDDPDAYEVALANITEMHRVLLVRLERLFQANDARDDERRRAEAAEAERDKELAARREVEAEREASDVHADRLLAERDEALARLDRPSPAIEELAAERDELQARIERVRHLADKWAEDAYASSIAGGESPRPADYSEGHYVGVMKTNDKHARELRNILAAPADDSSEAEARFKFVPDALYGVRWVPEPWMPKPGERVMGTVVPYTDPIVGTYQQRCDDVYSIVTDDDGDWWRVRTDSLRPAGGREQ